MGGFSISSRLYSLSITLLLAASTSFAQFYDKGQDPGGIKWENIRTDHFQVIFPEDFQSEGQRMAHILESYYIPNSDYLNHRPKPIPVILHNHSVRSNGFVSWAPKRMEVVTTPAAWSYSQDYLEQLALHEFRHVVQVDKLRQGFTKGLSFIIGEAATGAITGMMPFWFLEGDATDAETRLSHSGRGRLPSFEMEIKAILAEKPKMYSYEKVFFGSFRDYIPNHYKYGYQIVSHARNKYGNELWENVLNNTGRRPFTLYPNYFSIKKHTGLSKNGLYKETFKTLNEHWKDQAGKRSLSDMTKINQAVKKHFTSYRFPGYINDSIIFAEKSGIDQINEFVRIDSDGKEKRIHRPGFYNAVNISVASGKVVWAEVLSDPRWERRSYSVIKIYNLSSGVERILEMKTRYFAPDLSEDGLFITAIEVDLENQIFLTLMMESNGEIVKKEASPNNEFLQYPVWDDKNENIYMTSLGENGKSIVQYNVKSGEWDNLFEAGFEDIAELDCRGEYLVFRAGFSGIDNIYSLNLKTLQCQRVTSCKFGAFTPAFSANGDTLIYSEYSSQGFDIVKIGFNHSEFTPLDEVKDHREQLNLPTKEEESNVPVPGLPTSEYETKKYRKSTHLFKFHSWAPLYVDLDDPSIEDLEVNPGLMLMSQNLLSTATTVLGYEYNLEKKDHFLHAAFTYSGWYPVLQISADYGGLPYVSSTPDTNATLSTVETDLSVNVKVSLPLNLTHNRYVTGLRPSAEARFSRSYFYYMEPGEYRSGMTYLDYRMYFYSHLKRTGKDILPRFGFSLDFRFVDTPFEGEQLGSQIYGSGVLYIPGVLRHQTLRVFVGAQKQNPRRFLMGNIMSMPRGIHYYTAIEMQKITFDYVFPIAYPDLHIWRAAYFKRFRGSVFYDYAIGKQVYMGNGAPVDNNFQSLGMELTTDIHLAQIFVPFNLGGRFIWIPETGSTRTEFIFSVDLSQF